MTSTHGKGHAKGRSEFVMWLNQRRESRLKKTADDYEKLPENIRGAVAKVAGIKLARLDSMTGKERAALISAAKSLNEKIVKVIFLLAQAQIQE